MCFPKSRLREECGNPVHIGEVVGSIMLKLALRRELAELEKRISLDGFDRELSNRIDAILFLLDN